jgi:Histidine kinase-, DNA gyrase B-, and HSP90-like ATPase
MTLESPVEITPSASALIESLRGLGYSPVSAIADLVDNSIPAGAREIELDLEWNDGDPRMALLDDGCGMDRTTLGEALRFGGSGSAAIRKPSDLGRFGLGLKTASLSQCRRLTVVSRRDGHTCVLVLDVDVVAEHGWLAFAPTKLPEHPFASKLSQLSHGTLVFWDRMDSLGGLSGLDKQTFYLRLQDIRAHLGMIFHRFLDGDAQRIRISMNGRAVKPWDPFQAAHPATTEMPSERIRHAGSSFGVKPYVLPHRDRFQCLANEPPRPPSRNAQLCGSCDRLDGRRMGVLLATRKSGHDDSARCALHPSCQSDPRTEAREAVHRRLCTALGRTNGSSFIGEHGLGNLS